MFVAVVYFNHQDTGPYQSHRDTGGFEAFLGATKEQAVEKALLWARRWETTPKFTNNSLDPKPKYYGPYQVLVGELTEEAKTVKYELAEINNNDLDW